MQNLKFVKPVFCIAQLSDGLTAAGVRCSKRGVLGLGGLCRRKLSEWESSSILPLLSTEGVTPS